MKKTVTPSLQIRSTNSEARNKFQCSNYSNLKLFEKLRFKIWDLFRILIVLFIGTANFIQAQPVASVSPASFSKTFNVCYDSQGDTLKIFNTGSSDLTYSINKGYGINYDSTSADNYNTSPASTFHNFYTIGTWSDSVFFTITLNGDYDNANEYADLYVDGALVTSLSDGNLPNGTDITVNLAFGGATVANWLTDGILNVELRNSGTVGSFVGTELHRVQVRTSGAKWTTLSSTSGTVAAGDSDIITVTFNGANLGSGIYTSSLRITTNDAANPEFIIPTSMTINGYSEINLSSACIVFDTLMIYETQTKSVMISNTGCDPLIISSMTNSLAEYSVDTTSATLEAGDALTLNVTFSPASLGNFNDTIFISNNATDTFVCLSGVAVNKPIMSISPKTMNVTINSCNDSVIRQLKIKNTGANNLIVSSINPTVTTIGNPVAASCTPVTTGTCCNMGIYNVTFNAINNTTANATEGYQDYSATQKTFVNAGSTYTISVTTGTTYNEDVVAWIDFNNDGDFDDAGEQVFQSLNVYVNHSGNVTIPAAARQGQPLRMRVASEYAPNATPQPCNNVQYGQFEDYTVFIVPGLEISFASDTTSPGNPIAATCSPITTGTCCNMGIYNVTFNEIDNTTGNATEGYQDYSTTQKTIVTPGSTYSLSVTTGTSYNEDVMAWIDYNNDGDFDDAGEQVFQSLNVYVNHSDNVTIPTDAVTNQPLRMRVGSEYAPNLTPQPCNNVQYGQFEDYTVYIRTHSVAAGDSVFVDFTFKSQGLVNGVYSLMVPVNGNDPLNPADTVATTLTVNGTPDLTFSANCIAFDTIMEFLSGTKTFTAYNNGCDTLIVSSITNADSIFSLDTANFTLMPFDSIVLTATFSPVSSGTFTDTFTFVSNAGTKKVCLDGTATESPSISTNPDSLSVTLTGCNDSVTMPFTIYNNGLADLILNVNAFSQQIKPAPCTPATTGYCCNMGIYNVTFNTINNNSANGSAGYQDFTGTQSTNVLRGQSYSISITTGVTYNENVRAWVDWNNNGSFEGGEQVFESLNTFQNHSGNITIPITASAGTLRMRVGSDYAPNAAPQPCNNVVYGQFEDYAIVIESGISISPVTNDTIAPSDSMPVNVFFESGNLVNGTYINYISITSNDPINPVVVVPATLIVNGQPALALSKTCLNLDSIMQYTTSTDTFFIYNNGCDTLIIDSIGNDLSVFTHNINSASIEPWDSQMIVVTFSPTTNGTFNDTLFISNNDNDTMVCLLGKSFLSPLMTVTPKNLSATLSGCNDTINRTFKIKNNGSSPLNYMLDGDIGYNMTSTKIFTTYNERTDHIFTNIGQTDSVILTIKLNGNYSGSSEYADLYIDNNFIEQIPDGNIANGLEVVVTRVYTASQISSWLSDDTLLVSIINSGNVDPGTGDDLHQVNVRANGLQWLNSVSSTSGTINVNDSVFITTTFKATGLISGTYTGQIFVNNNDPFNPADTVNCTLTLIGDPQIALSSTCLDLDSIMQNTSNTKTLTIYNNGCDTLNVTSITNALSIFTKDTNNFVIMPFDSAMLNITFSPTSAGTFLDSLRIFNDDINKVVCLTGEAFPKPVISANPDSFNVVLASCNDSTTRNLTIYNTGGSNLIFNTNENGAGSSYDSTITIIYSSSDATTNHLFTNLPANDSLYLTITLNGDYDSGSEYAEVYVDGTYIELVPDGDPGNGTNIIRNYAFGGSQVNTWLADGQVTVTIDNSPGVDAFVGTEIHTAQLIIPGVSWLEVTPTADTTAAGDSTVLILKFNAVGVPAGTHTGILFVNSNDPLNPVIQIPLTLQVSGNPALSIAQNCLAHDTIMELTTSVKPFVISNTGCDTLFITNTSANTAFFSADDAGFFVPPLSSSPLQITFAPNAAGNFADTLFIQTNDMDTAICLTGVAFGKPIISTNPNPLIVTTTSCDDTTNAVVKIYNTGASNLNYNINQFFGTPLPPACTPTTLAYCCNNGIYNVTLNGMNFSSGNGADGYKDYSDSIGTILVPGTIYNIIVTTGDTNNERVKVWIDFNNSGTFDFGEMIMNLSNGLPTRTHSVFFGIPVGAVKNVPLRMRVRSEDVANTDTDLFGCDDVTNGQFEDYSVIIMSVSPTVAVVAPGDSASVTMPFISTGLPAGSYSGNLVISTNSPTQGEFTLPYTFSINGFASITLSDLCIDFDTTAVNATKSDTITIYNAGGCDTLFVTGISTGTAEFANDVSSLTILPSDSGQVIVSFTPASVGNFTDTLFITSSAGDTAICLSGIAKGAPVIVVIPDTLNGTVACGDSVTLTFKVKNIGIDTLNFTINDTTAWADFSTLNGTLAPDDSMNISAEFNSTAMGIGFYSESAVITSNDISNPSLDLVLNFTITSYPFAPDAVGASACELSPIPPLTASGTNIQWYADALHTTLLFAGDTFNTGQTLPGVYTYYVTQTVNGCESVDTSVNLVISDASNAATGITASADSICNGNSTMLIVAGGSLGAGGSWTWYADSCGGASIGTGDTITVSPNTNTTYFVRAEDACGATACVSKEIIVNTSAPAPVAEDTTTCGGGPVPPLTASGFNVKWYSDPGLTILLATGNSFNTGQTADGIYNYYVTQTLGGCESPADVATLIIGSSSVAVDSIDFNRDTICLGNSVTLSVNGGTLGTGAQWKWYSGSCGGTLVDSGATITVSPAVSTNYFVRAEGICNTTACVNKNIVVTGTAPASPVALDTVACENGTIPDLMATGATMQWYFDATTTILLGSGNSFATGQTAAGTYNYYATQTVGGCESNPDTATLVIYSVSTAATGISAADDSICLGTSVLLSVSGGSLGSGATWKWYDTGCGNNLVGTGTSILVSPTATTTYFVRAEGICDTTVCRSITITVISNVPAPTASDVSSCTGSVNSTLAATGSNVKWYDDAALTNLVFSGNTYNTGITAAGVYWFYATQTIGGCEGIADTMALTINDTSARATSIAASDDTICAGGTVTLSKLGGSLGTGAQWKWYLGSCGGTMIDSGTTITVSPAATTTYFVRAEGSCNTTFCRSITITVNSSAPPTPAAKDTAVCFGTAIPNLTATGSNIKWYADAGLTNLLGSGNSFATGQTDAGIYNYYVTQTVSDCESAPDTATLTINPKPFVTAFANPSTMQPGDTATLMAFNAVSYVWTPAVTLSSSTGATVMAFPVMNTTYTVTGTDGNGCTNTATVTVVVGPLGIADQPVAGGVSVYPNPTSGNLNIRIENAELRMQNAELRIYDMVGKMIYQSAIKNPQSEILMDYADGVYFLQIRTEKGQQWFKIAVEK